MVTEHKITLWVQIPGKNVLPPGNEFAANPTAEMFQPRH